MGRLLVVLLSFFCTLMTNAQIKTQREYDYVGTEINNAGLRVVGVKILMYTWKNGQKDYIEYYGCIDKNGNEVIPLEYKRI